MQARSQILGSGFVTRFALNWEVILFPPPPVLERSQELIWNTR